MPAQKPLLSPEKSAEYDVVRGAAVLAIGEFESSPLAELDPIVDRYAALAGVDARDFRFLKRIVNGVVKMRRRLDHELRFYLARPSEKLPPRLQNTLRVGLYQIRYMEKVPDAAAVDTAVTLARYFHDAGRARLVNAVLRTALREPDKPVFIDESKDPVKRLGDWYSYPDFFVRYCLTEFGIEKTRALLEHMNEPPALTIRVNLLRAKTQEVETELTSSGVGFVRGEFLEEFYVLSESAIDPLRGLLDSGKIYIQNQSAGMAVRLLNPRPDMTVLDLAAAPGGKATYAAARMRGKGRVTAVDKSRSRLELLVENAKRLGVKIISPVVADVTKLELNDMFDRVLVDPPCTGWGVAGRHADLRWRKTEDDSPALAALQQRMLERAATFVKPGGVMVYSTCTIMREENDNIVEEFLTDHKEFSLDSAEEFWPNSPVVSERGFVKAYPAFRPLDGAFAARLKRRPH